MKKLMCVALLLATMWGSANAQFGRREIKLDPDKSLQQSYRDYFMIGVAVNQRNIANPEQIALLKKEFNSITAENDMKPGELHPAPGVWDFERADRIADFCRQNGIKLRGHCLAWHSQFCDWMFYDYSKKQEKELNEKAKGPRERPLISPDGARMRRTNPYKGMKMVKKEVLYQRMKEHIEVVMKRYGDVVYAWDVFNEAINDQRWVQPLRESQFYKLVGSDEYIRKAFEFARQADPKALLFYNDFNECDLT